MSQSKPTGSKGTLVNDTSAFRRTLMWCVVATVIHVIIIGGVSASQSWFKSDAADKVADKNANVAANAADASAVDASNAASNTSSPTRNASRNSPSDDWLNPTTPNAAANRPAGNSAVERRVTEADSSRPDMTSGMNFDD
jgi:cytoskeletal protein RodZ